MKALLSLSLLLICPALLFGQFGKKKVTRAVIVGISDYKDDGIPDLQFAHKDAEVFDSYLQSPSGGSIAQEYIKLYTNETATGGNIHNALNWLVKESKRGDICLIYFSGHGDVETIYSDEPGHFLLYDTPSSTYQVNSLRLDDLSNIIKTLSEKNQAKVTLITDACRSGQLAGSLVNGTQATAVALSRQFANELKLMSCQASEFSFEGKEWGGGRGMFSYHLIEGLIGLADRDDNQEVTLREVERYLEDRFEEDLTDVTQSPVAIGNKTSRLAFVDPASLAVLLDDKTDYQASPALAEASVQSKAPSYGDLEISFYKAIKDKVLLKNDSETDNVSAEYYLRQILGTESLAHKHDIMKGDFIAALQDDAQVAINKYLAFDNKEMNKRWFGDISEFQKYPPYLAKAAELLSQYHFLYPQVKAKEIYFDVVTQRIQLELAEADSIEYIPLIEKLKEALVYQPRSPFIYNELGLIYQDQKRYALSEGQFKKAIEISPTWVIPYNNISLGFYYQGEYEKCITWAKNSNKVKPNNLGSLNNLSFAYQGKQEFNQSIKFNKLIIDNYEQMGWMYNNLAYNYVEIGDLEKAFSAVQKGLEIKPIYYDIYHILSNIQIRQGNYKGAVKSLRILKKNNPDQGVNFYINLALSYTYLDQSDEAIKAYKHLAELAPSHSYIMYLGEMLLDNYNYLEAIKYYEIFFKHHLSTADAIDCKNLAFSYAGNQQLTKFEKTMEKAISLGFNNKKEMEESTHLSSIRSSSEYLKILSKMK